MLKKRVLLRCATFCLCATPSLFDVSAQAITDMTKSRWAMDDPEYAEKYANGASKTDVVGKIKQASDARFVKDKFGIYGAAGFASLSESNQLLTIDVGATGYWTSYLTNRVGFLAAFDDDNVFTGGEIGIRLQTPTRLAPFAGLGLFGGYARESVDADDDMRDNDDDGFVDEFGEMEKRFSGALLAVYPEAGVHFWWSPYVRVSGFGRYLVTTEGRDSDGAYYGGAITWFTRR